MKKSTLQASLRTAVALTEFLSIPIVSLSDRRFLLQRVEGAHSGLAQVRGGDLMERPREDDDGGRDEGRDEVLVSALAAGQTYQEAGDLIGRSARTVRRLAADTELRRRVAERRREMAANAAARSAALVEAAIGVLEELLRDPVPVVRLRAADAALRYHFRFAAEVAVLDDVQDLRDALDELRTYTHERPEGS